ncbi:hypothetical protein L484_002541 [Morus notabilis]|uniref:Uncharacterized protein n=1 Tax=Morus notabilis TaxID=981085 RepID=W9RTS7_9ROSA|nr:hypothetical protein L484_002541 [Morus notabilis]
MEGWAVTETREETRKEAHWEEGGQAQDPSSQAETTRAGLRFEGELNNEATEDEKVPEGESILARETRVRRRPRWLNSFELNGDSKGHYTDIETTLYADIFVVTPPEILTSGKAIIAKCHNSKYEWEPESNRKFRFIVYTMSQSQKEVVAKETQQPIDLKLFFKSLEEKFGRLELKFDEIHDRIDRAEAGA